VDFANVRIHTNSQADEAARSIDARAFTKGNDIVFAKNEYNPQSSSGKKLMAHELTHVVQQQKGTLRKSKLHRKKRKLQISATTPGVVHRAVTIGAIAAKCIIGAIVGALFDLGLQAALHSWKNKTWKFWKAKFNYCKVILSAILGCIAAPIAAYKLEPWITKKLGSRLGGIVGSLTGKILLFIAKKLGMAILKSIIGTLLKLGCISTEQSTKLGVKPS
jgi:hypothetical protein